MLVWLDARLFLVSVATAPLGVWALARYRGRLDGTSRCCASAAPTIGSFLIETLQGVRLVVTSNAQEREVQRVPRAQRRRSSTR